MPRVLLVPDLPLDEGDTFAIGSIGVSVLHVPGHSRDHLLFYLPRPHAFLFVTLYWLFITLEFFL